MVTRSASDWTPNRIVALILGVVFLLIGILGLLFDTTHGSLLGFDVDLVHNLVHLLTGIVGLWAAFTGWSRRFNQVFGIISTSWSALQASFLGCTLTRGTRGCFVGVSKKTKEDG